MPTLKGLLADDVEREIDNFARMLEEFCQAWMDFHRQGCLLQLSADLIAERRSN
jgi:hypothetical protein